MERRICKAISVGALLLAATMAGAQRPEPEVVTTWGGDEVYQVLPLGAIPAIDDPTFVTGKAADARMRPEEPVLGVVIGDTARAYSLWHLDAHEIVNDEIEGTAIAATW
jgi:hypothetical protein